MAKDMLVIDVLIGYNENARDKWKERFLWQQFIIMVLL